MAWHGAFAESWWKPGLRGSAVSCSLRYSGPGAKKTSLVTHQDKQLRKCTTWFHLHIPYLHQESTAAWHISTQKFLPSLLRLHLNWRVVQPGLSASGFMQLHWSYMGFNYLEGIQSLSYKFPTCRIWSFSVRWFYSRVPKFDPKWLVTYLLAPSWCWSARPCFYPERAWKTALCHVFCKDSWPLSSVHRC